MMVSPLSRAAAPDAGQPGRRQWHGPGAAPKVRGLLARKGKVVAGGARHRNRRTVEAINARVGA